MTIEQFDKYHKAKPFRPFEVFLADGRSFPVRHPEFALRNLSGRTIAVVDESDDAVETIDLLLVTSLGHMKHRKNGSRSSRR